MWQGLSRGEILFQRGQVGGRFIVCHVHSAQKANWGGVVEVFCELEVRMSAFGGEGLRSLAVPRK